MLLFKTYLFIERGKKLKQYKNSKLKIIAPTWNDFCISRINNRLIFKIKDGLKLELQLPETMKPLDSPKN